MDWIINVLNGVDFGSKYLKLGEKIIAKYADEIIVLSKNMKQYFKDKYNRETTYIPNGIPKGEKKKSKHNKKQIQS